MADEGATPHPPSPHPHSHHLWQRPSPLQEHKGVGYTSLPICHGHILGLWRWQTRRCGRGRWGGTCFPRLTALGGERAYLPRPLSPPRPPHCKAACLGYCGTQGTQASLAAGALPCPLGPSRLPLPLGLTQRAAQVNKHPQSSRAGEQAASLGLSSQARAPAGLSSPRPATARKHTARRACLAVGKRQLQDHRAAEPARQVDLFTNR